jgi:hypothetical protein
MEFFHESFVRFYVILLHAHMYLTYALLNTKYLSHCVPKSDMIFLNTCLIESLRYLSVPKNIFAETIFAVSLTDYRAHAIITRS